MTSRKPIRLRSEKEIPKAAKKIDALSIARDELFVVRHPEFRKTPFTTSAAWKMFVKEMKGRDCWMYWPADRIAVRMFDEAIYFELRTARNKNLITKEEQDAYRNLSIGIAGLSVGSSILSALVLSGGPKKIKIADFDTLEPTNLNRIRAGIPDLTSKKIELAARDVWRVDPFAELSLWDKGLPENGVEEFIQGRPRLDIVIDEMDNLALKTMIRIVARRERIPVLMATDNGDGIMLDVERFDLEPKRRIFHGLVGNLTVAQARNATGKKWFELAEKIIGISYMPKRHKESLREIGKTLAGVPQLGTDAMSAGAVMSLAVRRIASGVPLVSGKYVFDMNKIFAKPVVR